MEIDTFYLECPLLKKHIEYYYFQKTGSPDFTTEYYAFPNTLQALNIHKNVTCDINSYQVKVTGCESQNYLMILQGRFQLPLYVQQKGRLDKITIIFKPLGLNHFIQSPYSTISAQPSQIFTDWSNDSHYLPFLHSFYKEQNNRQRIDILESFLLSRYIDCQEAEELQPVLKLLSNFSEELSIKEVANKVQLNVRTLNRLFAKHLSISPVGYKKIARFRSALKNKLFEKHFITLTRIGYESNFYDQSYFNKIYKKVTGESPSRFFKSVESMADNNLIFKFINKPQLSEKYNLQ